MSARTGWRTLARAWLPSWRFFDEPGAPSRWLFRVGISATEFGPWESALPAERRGFGELFLNAPGNLRLAAQSLMERLLEELSELEEHDAGFSVAVSYRLAERWVRAHIHRIGRARPGLRFQFKIASGDEDALVSRVHEVME